MVGVRSRHKKCEAGFEAVLRRKCIIWGAILYHPCILTEGEGFFVVQLPFGVPEA